MTKIKQSKIYSTNQKEKATKKSKENLNDQPRIESSNTTTPQIWPITPNKRQKKVLQVFFIFMTLENRRLSTKIKYLPNTKLHNNHASR
jgi:hypothetical protein